MGTRLVQDGVGEIVKGNGEEVTKVLAEQGRPPFLSLPVLCRAVPKLCVPCQVVVPRAKRSRVRGHPPTR